MAETAAAAPPTADDFAKWIVANEHLAGTPDFQTVTKAYEEAKQLEAAPPPQEELKDATIGSSFQAGLDASTENLGRTAQMTAQAIEGGLIPKDVKVSEIPMPNLRLPWNEQRPEGQVGEPLFDIKVADHLLPDYVFGPGNFEAKWDPDIMPSADKFKAAGDWLRNAVDAPKGYKSASEEFIKNDGKQGFKWSETPNAFIEQVGQLGGSLATRAVGAGIGGAVGGVPGAVIGGLGGPMMFEVAQQIGPMAAERAKNNNRPGGVPTEEDWLEATKYAGASGLLNAIGIGKLPGTGTLTKRLAAGFARIFLEGSTEGTQSVVQQAGNTVGTNATPTLDDFRPNLKQAVGEGLLGGMAAGGVKVASLPVEMAVDKAKKPMALSDDPVVAKRQKYARAELAEKIKHNAKAEPEALGLKDSNPNRYRNTAMLNLGQVHKGILEAINNKIKVLKPLLMEDNPSQEGMEWDANLSKSVADALEALKLDQNRGAGDHIAAALGAGKNKRHGLVDEGGRALIEVKVGGLKEGRQLLNLLDQSNELTKLTNSTDGLGGMSKYAEILNPLSGGSQYLRTAKATLAALATNQAATVGSAGLWPAIAAGIYATARAIDKQTGLRYPVDKWVGDWENLKPAKNRAGLAGKPTLQSYKDAQAQDAAATAAHLEEAVQERAAVQGALRNLHQEAAALRKQANKSFTDEATILAAEMEVAGEIDPAFIESTRGKVPAAKTAQWIRLAHRLEQNKAKLAKKAEATNTLAKINKKIEAAQKELERANVKKGKVAPSTLPQLEPQMPMGQQAPQPGMAPMAPPRGQGPMGGQGPMAPPPMQPRLPVDANGPFATVPPGPPMDSPVEATQTPTYGPTLGKIRSLVRWREGKAELKAQDKAVQAAALGYREAGDVEFADALDLLIEKTNVPGGAKGDPKARGELWRAIFDSLDSADERAFREITMDYQQRTDNAEVAQARREAKAEQEAAAGDVPFP